MIVIVWLDDLVMPRLRDHEIISSLLISVSWPLVHPDHKTEKRGSRSSRTPSECAPRYARRSRHVNVRGFAEAKVLVNYAPGLVGQELALRLRKHLIHVLKGHSFCISPQVFCKARQAAET